ncbi:hypothetical protein [Noviherbaspirillum autotrophicum]|uniref:Uncharacterized protein n=1 Tax=Noviherbaspirillum autotrophicum TaxID=709839 RepID=A0A0C2BHY5_9BURK|nr:hypothetical protein [Noviherbaspirillum autotrophicum]KIF80797.1 hypothetical protein TSA66_08145 [Noviherbaspirillum autotrophicum]KIF80835.1 hypothetical protein TSA66_08390 [Noviherbaspirillum autotrophicum]KIF84060.1 hypothetical protein TSA66_01080 [Noviherbaspirillum autotrophicum]
MNDRQFSLFDTTPDALPRIDWTSQVYSKEYNAALNAMLIDACRQQPKSTADLHQAQLAEFGLGEIPLGCQLTFLAEIGKLRRKVDKAFVSTWSAA